VSPRSAPGAGAATSASAARRPTAAWALAALLALLALGQLVRDFDPATSVDFYQFWGVGAARARHPELPTPWSQPEPYRRALEERFAGETHPALERVHRYRMQAFEPFASPLLYLAFAAFPGDYVTALALQRALQALAFAGAVVLLGWLSGCPLPWLAVLPGLLLLFYRPLGDDLRVGNVNALQLGALALLLAAVAPRRGERWREPSVRRGALVLMGAAALALFKANLAPALLGLAAALALQLGTAGAARACAGAAPGLLLLVLAPVLAFGSARAWLDWGRSVFAAEPARLADYAVADGNTSTPRLLEELLGVPALVSAGLVAALLAASLVRLPRRAWRDPRLGVGLGVAGMLAASPLVWFHYFVLALAPGLWLATSPRIARLPRVLALGTLAVLSAAYLPLVPRAGLPLLQGVWSLAWVPLWTALWLHARRTP
jgi:hypothetical protein